ncbi:MAG: alpha/beta hydrolase [Bacteroidota bacterium]|nr:alpha/beta hydrolase [Bacteroidota bacterium]
MALAANAQTFLPIWNKRMPNSRGIVVNDTIVNERITQVGTPGVYVFEPSKAENTGTAVLIIPGGGYARLSYQISGFTPAKWLNSIGITAFVLNHRLPQSPDVEVSYKAPLQDAQRALRYIRAHAAEYGIDSHKIGVMGCSAGGHLSACVSTINEDWSAIGDSLDNCPFQPNFTILISPVISMADSIVHKGSRTNLLGKWKNDEHLRRLFSCDLNVTAQTPPAILFHASDDPAVPPLNSIAYYSALLKAGVKKSSIHIFPNGGHKIAVRAQPGSTRLWTELTEEWLIETGFLKPIEYK